MAAKSAVVEIVDTVAHCTVAAQGHRASKNGKVVGNKSFVSQIVDTVAEIINYVRGRPGAQGQ